MKPPRRSSATGLARIIGSCSAATRDTRMQADTDSSGKAVMLTRIAIAKAHIDCPYSNATRNNIDVTLSIV
jgi:organic hydroperoxide reductase OsmC/OhrA